MTFLGTSTLVMEHTGDGGRFPAGKGDGVMVLGYILMHDMGMLGCCTRSHVGEDTNLELLNQRSPYIPVVVD